LRAAPTIKRAPTAVVIGTSTGGPNALVEVLAHLPASFPVPILVVQHMPATFTRLLAQRINSKCALEVVESSDGGIVTPGRVIIARGGVHLVVAREGGHVVTRDSSAAPENSCRPAVDVLFRSAAALWGSGLLAVVMTGMGHDGLVGAQEVCQRGGAVITQDEASSVVWSMPGSVATTGLSSESVPLSQIASVLGRRCAASLTSVPA
jgi:two-component system chemotaxis response regulator CheB